MGSRMAQRLLDKGLTVHGYTRTPGRATHLDDLGITRHTSPADVATRSDVIFMMLWDSKAVEAALVGPSGLFDAMRPGTVIVDCSTIEPAVSSRLAVEAQRRGGSLIDSPVSGSLDRASEGRLLAMVGGTTQSLSVARSAMEVLADRIVHVGPNGSGLAVKLAINLQVALQLVAWGESLPVALEAGLSVKDASEVMLESVIASPMLQYRVPLTLRQPDEVWASVVLLRKDVGYARAAGASGPASEYAEQLLEAIIADGRGEKEAAELADEAARVGART
jgi:3-hydroxyisobutyrate dehydrogenase